jgi:hypothetical protein
VDCIISLALRSFFLPESGQLFCRLISDPFFFIVVLHFYWVRSLFYRCRDPCLRSLRSGAITEWGQPYRLDPWPAARTRLARGRSPPSARRAATRRGDCAQSSTTWAPASSRVATSSGAASALCSPGVPATVSAVLLRHSPPWPATSTTRTPGIPSPWSSLPAVRSRAPKP